MNFYLKFLFSYSIKYNKYFWSKKECTPVYLHFYYKISSLYIRSPIFSVLGIFLIFYNYISTFYSRPLSFIQTFIHAKISSLDLSPQCLSIKSIFYPGKHFVYECREITTRGVKVQVSQSPRVISALMHE